MPRGGRFKLYKRNKSGVFDASGSGSLAVVQTLTGAASWIGNVTGTGSVAAASDMVLAGAGAYVADVTGAGSAAMAVTLYGIDAELGDFLAFPGAMGFAADNSNFRGWASGSPAIRHVTNLAGDASAGSFRAAVESNGPAVVVFDVSGYITLDDDVDMGNNLYVAGQTAPNKGVMIRRGTVNLGSNCIVRHLRLTPGDQVGGGNIADRQVAFGENASSYCWLDHCSLAWAVDEVMDSHAYATQDYYAHNISNCLIAEGLSQLCGTGGAHTYRTPCTGHPEGEHSRGMLFDSVSGSSLSHGLSIVRSGLVGSYQRHPYIKPTTMNLLLLNNYLAPGQSTSFSMQYPVGPPVCRIEGNIAQYTQYSTDPANHARFRLGPVSEAGDFPSGTAFYVPTVDSDAVSDYDPPTGREGVAVLDTSYGNDVDGTTVYRFQWEGTSPSWEVNRGYEVSSPPFSLPTGVIRLLTSATKAHLKSYVGARPSDRLARLETRQITWWFDNPTSSSSRVLDGVEVDSGETPESGAEYVEGTGPTYGGNGTGWPNDLTQETGVTWQTPNDRWGVGNFDQKPGEATGWTWMDYALHLDHLACGGTPVGL